MLPSLQRIGFLLPLHLEVQRVQAVAARPLL
jgi:hypothetical protein